jgi:Flp pilus assembly protein TadG
MRMKTARRLRQMPGAFRADLAANVVVTFALMLPVLVGACWAAINIANTSFQHTAAQGVADAAALAAARMMSLSNVSSASVQQSAIAFAQAQLPASVDLAKPDQVSATVDAANGSVTVSITRYLAPLAGVQFGVTANALSVSSTAQYKSTQICVLVLDPAASSAFNAFANSNVMASSCAIISDSAATDGLSGTTNGKITSSKACSAGGYAGSAFKPTPITDCPVVPDPLASRAPPPNVNNGCDHTNFTFSSSSLPLQPGVYCGGISIKQGTAVFNPGDYILRGGALTISGGGAVQGSDVGIYLTGGAVLDGQPNSGISLTAPSSSSDPMVGLVFWEDPHNMPAGSPATHKIWSDNAQNIHGTVYFPQGALNVGGHANIGGAADYTIIVAHDLVVFQSANIVLNANYGASNVPVPSGVGNSATRITLTK